MLYNEGARILEVLDNKKGTVKSLCLSSKVQNKKQLYALVCETLKYRKVIRQIIEATKILKLERSLTPSLAQLLIYDFLFGRGVNNAPKKLKGAVLNHKSALKSELARVKIKAKVTKNKDLLSDQVKNEVALPRYVRVNLLKTTVADVIEHFNKESYTLIGTRGLPYNRFIDVVARLQPKQFVVDIHIPELLVFNSKTDLHDHVLYTSGDIILQDKASCIPAHVLAPPPGSHVIDCCAAPGNKTTHAASYLGNRGRIFSFDLDARRLATMATLTLKAGVLCADLTNQDFLKVDPTDPKYAKVTHAIVDPSCSGSGIVSRLNSLTDDEDSSSTSRLQKLSDFQKSILTHAWSFPAMQRVVYSTCSVHAIENEAVVKHVLRKLAGLVRTVEVLPDLPGRGGGSFPGSSHAVRLDPQRDLTNGFFVACFERVAEGEVTPIQHRADWSSDDGDSDNDNGADDNDDMKTENKTPDTGLVVDEISILAATPEGECEETQPAKKKKKKKKKKKNIQNENGVTDKDSCPDNEVSVTEMDEEKKKRNTTNIPRDSGETIQESQSSNKRSLESEAHSEPCKKVKLPPVSLVRTDGKKKKQKRKKCHRPVTM